MIVVCDSQLTCILLPTYCVIIKTCLVYKRHVSLAKNFISSKILCSDTLCHFHHDDAQQMNIFVQARSNKP